MYRGRGRPGWRGGGAVGDQDVVQREGSGQRETVGRNGRERDRQTDTEIEREGGRGETE